MLLGGSKERKIRAPRVKNVFICMQFLEKYGQVVGWRPLWVGTPGKYWIRPD